MTDTTTLAPTQTGEYPKLPEPAMFDAVDRQGNPVSHGYSASQVLALIDADRAARGAAPGNGALAAPAQPVVWALQWPDDSRLNISTVFDTQLEATDYLKSCSDGVVVVPLYAAPQPTAQAQDDAEACADTRRLNFLESRGCDGWIARMSTTGRGYRLHQSHGNPFATARDAIDAAIAAQQGDAA